MPISTQFKTKFEGVEGLGEAYTLYTDQQSDPFINSRIEAGGNYHLFVPLYSNKTDANGKPVYTLMAYGVAGRKMDRERMGFSFASLPASRNEFNQLVDESGLESLGRISAVLYEAEYFKECAAARTDAENVAKANGTVVDSGALAVKLNELDMAFHGGTVEGKNVPATRSRLIQNIGICMTMSPILMKLKDSDNADAQYPVTRVTLELTGSKASMMQDVASKITQDDIDRGFVEIVYKYEGKDKKEAGQKARFEYCTKRNWIAEIDSNWWQAHEADIKSKFIVVPKQLQSKNRNITNTPSVPEIFSAFRKYCKKQQVLNSFITEEIGALKYAAKDMLEMPVFTSTPALKDLLTKMTASDDTAAATDVDTSMNAEATTQVPAEEVTNTPVISDTVAAVAESGEDALEATSNFTEEEMNEMLINFDDDPSAL